jgi:hypothetical protein
MYGTVARIDSWLLLEHPNTWMPQAIAESDLPEAVRRRVRRICEENPRIRPLLIRQGYGRSESLACFVVRSSEASPVAVRLSLSAYHELAESDLAALETRAGAEVVRESQFLVCTHGTHDKCCAKFGLPVYERLRAVVGNSAWQCSHVGGDRFAANVVCLPHGIYYGHVCPDDVAPIVDAHNHGEICLKNYRGRCCYPRAVQVGEYFVRAESGRTRIDEFRFVPGIERDGGITHVRFRSTSDGSMHTAEYRTKADQFREFLTCKAKEASAVAQYELVRYSIATQ